MNRHLLLSILIFLAISCDTNTGSEPTAKVPEQNKISADTSDCYQYINNTNTVTLKLVHIGDTVTGTLRYTSEKSKDRGTINGSMQGDLLVANFTSEIGFSAPVRQIAFKKESGCFIEGHGEVDRNSRWVFFKDLHSLKFDEERKLKKINCL